MTIGHPRLRWLSHRFGLNPVQGVRPSRIPPYSLRCGVESLECRIVLSSYQLSVNQWATGTGHLTYSIPADGVYWNHGVNAINSSFDQLLGSQWRTAIAQAISEWSSVANIDIAQVPDQGLDFDYGGLAQGDPRFGDIRIGGYNFQNPVVMAVTATPPPFGYTQAGDVQVNLGLNWNLGRDYDFQTVILHELGHSLGLEHSTDPGSMMFEQYEGVRQSLAPDDIQGVQAIYGVRKPDALNAQGFGLSMAAPVAIPQPVLGARISIIHALSLAKSNEADYFEVKVPQGFIGDQLVVTASAGSISMLSPKISQIGSDGSVIQAVSTAGVWGASVSVNVGQVVPGQILRFRVDAAESGRFDIGGYSLTANYQGGQVPVPPVVTVAPVPVPLPVSPPAVVVPPAAPKPVPVAPAQVVQPVTTPVPASPVVTKPTRPAFFHLGRPDRSKPVKPAKPVKPIKKTINTMANKALKPLIIRHI